MDRRLALTGGIAAIREKTGGIAAIRENIALNRAVRTHARARAATAALCENRARGRAVDLYTRYRARARIPVLEYAPIDLYWLVVQILVWFRFRFLVHEFSEPSPTRLTCDACRPRSRGASWCRGASRLQCK